MSKRASSAQRRDDGRTESLLRQACATSDPVAAAEARREAVLLNTSLALSLARQFDRRGIEHDDLVQVAMLGLVQAARRYRPGAGRGFAGYAVPTINGELKRHFRDHGWAVRPPRGLQELHRDVRAARARLQQERGHTPTAREVAEALAIDVRDVRRAELLDEQYTAASLDSPAPEGGTLGDVFPDESREDPYDRVVSLVSLRSAMSHLDRRERTILRLRYVDNLTQRQIGRRIGVSQMQVSRLLSDIVRRLRRVIDEAEPTGGTA